MGIINKTAPETILLKGRGRRREAVAGGTIKPGQLVALTSTGTLVAHATAGGVAAPIFAVENDLNGKGITDNYASGDYVQAEHLTSGCEVYAQVSAAVARGALLQSDGAGNLVTVTTGEAIAQALEAAAGAGFVRVLVL